MWLKSSRSLLGPYLIAQVVRQGVYKLSDNNGKPENNNSEVTDEDLIPVA